MTENTETALGLLEEIKMLKRIEGEIRKLRLIKESALREIVGEELVSRGSGIRGPVF